MGQDMQRWASNPHRCQLALQFPLLSGGSNSHHCQGASNTHRCQLVPHPVDTRVEARSCCWLSGGLRLQLSHIPNYTFVALTAYGGQEVV